MPPTFEFGISSPSAVSSLAFHAVNALCAGSDDGAARFYDLPSKKVAQAVRPLGLEISSTALQKNRDNRDEVWIASGHQVLSFKLDNAKLILSDVDASSTLVLGEDDEDALNELAVSDNGRFLAFGTDAGTVGILEVATQNISKMKTGHTNICGSVKFIPDRPSEVVSGGYDSAILHFDFNQGSILSRFDIAAAPPSSGVSLSPPFVLSISVASTGLFAAATADGRVWLGGGGEKRSDPSRGKKKRSRKWEGLKADEGIWMQVAEGPVVAIQFASPMELFTCSLLGTISTYRIYRDDADRLTAEKTWSSDSSNIAKVNAMALSQNWLVVGGIVEDGKGIIEVWNMQEQSVVDSITT